MSNTIEASNKVLSGLQILICSTLRQHEAERKLPMCGADEMDHFIGETGERVKLLRKLREEFENEMARALELDLN